LNPDPDVLVQLAYALGIGLIIGLERSFGPLVEARTGMPEGESPPEREFLGIRTFGTISLTGFVAGHLSGFHDIAAVAIVVGLAALVALLYLRSPPDRLGITTEVAALATGGLGFLCRFDPGLAAVLALAFTVLLASKRFTVSAVSRMRRVELTDTLKFLVVILIVLPLLPEEAVDPLGAIQPYKVGLLVVLISGIGFVGYFLTRILGTRRGLGLTGLLGGLTSSTAVTAAMAAEARQHPGHLPVCVFSTVAANATMFARLLVVVGMLLPDLAWTLAMPFGTMLVVAAVLATILWKRTKAPDPAEPASSETRLKNPFSLGPALKFALLFAGILLLARWANQTFGQDGLLLASVLSGLADVDAITLSITGQVQEDALGLDTAALGITLAVVANSVVKAAMALVSGGKRFGLRVAAALLSIMGTGLLATTFF
jgi:uncharacterized membrane protein (DUF4010 family)